MFESERCWMILWAKSKKRLWIFTHWFLWILSFGYPAIYPVRLSILMISVLSHHISFTWYFGGFSHSSSSFHLPRIKTSFPKMYSIKMRPSLKDSKSKNGLRYSFYNSDLIAQSVCFLPCLQKVNTLPLIFWFRCIGFRSISFV